MSNTIHIRSVSRKIRILLTLLLPLIPLTGALAWLFINRLPEAMLRNMLPSYAVLPLPPQAQILGFIAAFIPAAVAMYGMVILIRLFRLYESGQVFRAENVRCFQLLSRVLIAWFIALIISDPLMSIALTLHHPPGQRMVEVTLGSPDLTALLVGVILAVIAWVMEEGRKMQDEQDYTV